MRTRATVAALSGALALSALAVPASHAADRGDIAQLTRSLASSVQSSAAATASTAPSAASKGSLAAAKAADTAPQITKVVVNGGKPVVLGVKTTQKISLAITATDDSGIGGAAGFLWTGGKTMDDATNVAVSEADDLKCKVVNATTTTCTHTVTVRSKYLLNNEAKTWNAYAVAIANDDGDLTKEKAGTAKFQRASQLTVSATPKPVKKGKTLTVTGKLSRANWETGKNAGYASQSVKLQFRKKGTDTYTTIKTVKGSSTGTLKTTTTKTTAEGYWRWSFAGTASTPAVSAPGTLVKITK
ncbi:DUF5707 domain-containing protein [Streptomyces sp. NPDC093109]|uniref:DUF5707 domain-containing protein n=1 Tax=Streptomyces sp. NPDC093109 TaxID=3154977 RepID=UPI003450FAB1